MIVTLTLHRIATEQHGDDIAAMFTANNKDKALKRGEKILIGVTSLLSTSIGLIDSKR
jgi:hypothetical protein